MYGFIAGPRIEFGRVTPAAHLSFLVARAPLSARLEAVPSRTQPSRISQPHKTRNREGTASSRADTNDQRRALAPEELAAVKWRFNAWAKYPNWKHDEKIGSLMARTVCAEELQPMLGKNRVVLEGGSIEVNGCGSLITTEECLLSRIQQRNPGMKKREYEKIFAQYR